MVIPFRNYRSISRRLTTTFLAIILSLLPGPLSLSRCAASAQTIDRASSAPARSDLISATAVEGGGVLIKWLSRFEKENVGFDVYRVNEGQRIRVNTGIVAGSAFANTPSAQRSGISSSFFDRTGAADATYEIESISLDGTRRVTGKVRAIRGTVPGFDLPRGGQLFTEGSAGVPIKEFPSGFPDPQLPSSLNGQWAVAAQPALKIQVDHAGWYRVTQPQMAAAQFNPGEISHLSLFANGIEVAIRASKDTGQLTSADFIEFYGFGLDTPDADQQVYYLVAGAQPGKRITGPLRFNDDADSAPPAPPKAPSSSSLPALKPVPSVPDLLDRGPFAPLLIFSRTGVLSAAPAEGVNAEASRTTATASTSASESSSTSARGDFKMFRDSSVSAISVSETGHTKPLPSVAAQSHQTVGHPGGNRSSSRRSRSVHYSHALVTAAPSGFSFQNSVFLKDRSPAVYFINLLNGDAENWFGHVISTTPQNLTLPVHNLLTGSTATAQLQVALQGVNSNPHNVNLLVN